MRFLYISLLRYQLKHNLRLLGSGGNKYNAKADDNKIKIFY